MGEIGDKDVRESKRDGKKKCLVYQEHMIKVNDYRL